MMPNEVDQIYVQHIQRLSAEEKLQLLQRIAAAIIPVQSQAISKPNDIRDLHGLGAKIWKDVDVDQYINELRDEWDNRP